MARNPYRMPLLTTMTSRSGCMNAKVFGSTTSTLMN